MLAAGSQHPGLLGRDRMGWGQLLGERHHAWCCQTFSSGEHVHVHPPAATPFQAQGPGCAGCWAHADARSARRKAEAPQCLVESVQAHMCAAHGWGSRLGRRGAEQHPGCPAGPIRAAGALAEAPWPESSGLTLCCPQHLPAGSPLWEGTLSSSRGQPGPSWVRTRPATLVTPPGAQAPCPVPAAPLLYVLSVEGPALSPAPPDVPVPLNSWREKTTLTEQRTVFISENRNSIAEWACG